MAESSLATEPHGMTEVVCKLSDLYTRFAVARRCDGAPGGVISDLACPLASSPHAKFAASAVRDVCAGRLIGSGPGSGYGRYTRFEFWAQTTAETCTWAKGAGSEFIGQWHTQASLQSSSKNSSPRLDGTSPSGQGT